MMQILPPNGLEIIEFDKVLDLVAGYCISAQGKAKVNQIIPLVEVDDIRDSLSMVDDAMRLHGEGDSVLARDIPQVQTILTNLKVDGYVLDTSHLATLRNLLRTGWEVFNYFDEEPVRKSEYKALYHIAGQIPDSSHWLGELDKILTEEGAIRDDASPVLINIAREMNARRREGDKVFQRVIRKYSKSNWLADTIESVRNDRRVLAVKAEFKRKIRGIVHDQSATGRTAFVEPEEVIGINNDLFELSAARRAEEYRLRAEACEMLRPFTSTIAIVEEVLAEIDAIFASARFAMLIDATIPTIGDSPDLSMRGARHPLLLLKNNRDGKVTVPFDLDLHGSNRMLLLSGPNAGGKSILMKSVGLLQVMVQSGMPVPVSPESEFGIFGKLCIELGDRQSIENDLSTYSSRLLDMKTFIEEADEQTLLLIDEFGSGTDPKLGGAIAEAILDSLHASGAYGVFTTHYSELKVYAYKKKGVLNGAMVFDKEKMEPTYMLRIGKPGSSFTFEIAGQTGLPKQIIDYAKEKAGKNTRAMEDLLIDLESSRQQLDQKLREVADKEKNVDRLMANYDRMRNDLAVQRKRLKLEQKERDYQHLSKLNKDLEKAVREAREKSNLKEAKKQLQRVKAERKKANESIRGINEELTDRTRHAVKKDWKPGDPVKIAGGSHTGKIESIDRKQATVIIGQLRMTVKLKDLVPAGEPLDINPVRSVVKDVRHETGFNNMLDIRGMRVQEAHKLLEKFMDSALLADAHMIKIVHGKGTGALKRLVEDKLREYPISDLEQPEDQHGGAGLTIVTL